MLQLGLDHEAENLDTWFLCPKELVRAENFDVFLIRPASEEIMEALRADNFFEHPHDAR